METTVDIEEILTRADAHIRTCTNSPFSNFSDLSPKIFRKVTTIVVSNSDKPITKEESEIITRMKRNMGHVEEIVFIPEPQ